MTDDTQKQDEDHRRQREEALKRQTELNEQQTKLQDQLKESLAMQENLQAQIREQAEGQIKTMLEEQLRQKDEQVKLVNQQILDVTENQRKLQESLTAMQEQNQRRLQEDMAKRQIAEQGAFKTDLTTAADQLDEHRKNAPEKPLSADIDKSIEEQAKLNTQLSDLEDRASRIYDQGVSKGDIDDIASRIPDAKKGDHDGREVARPESDRALGVTQDRWTQHESGQRALLGKMKGAEDAIQDLGKKLKEHVSTHGNRIVAAPANGSTPNQLSEHEALRKQQEDMRKEIDKHVSEFKKTAEELKKNEMTFQKDSWGRVATIASISGDKATQQRAEQEREKLEKKLDEMKQKHNPSGIGRDEEKPGEEKQEQKLQTVSEAYLKNQTQPLSVGSKFDPELGRMAKEQRELSIKRGEERQRELDNPRIKQNR